MIINRDCLILLLICRLSLLPARSRLSHHPLITSTYPIPFIPKYFYYPIKELDLTHVSNDAVGVGASMRVHLAHRNHELVAVKVAQSEHMDLSQRQHLDRRLHDLYFELQIMSHEPLSSHLNIVRLLRVSFQEEFTDVFTPLLIVEPANVVYPDLDRLLEYRGFCLGSDLSRNLISDIADGIAVLHVYGVIHRNVKPSNILIFSSFGSQSLTVKVCDFGFSGC
jgi:serine/threonine protein kinase